MDRGRHSFVEGSVLWEWGGVSYQIAQRHFSLTYMGRFLWKYANGQLEVFKWTGNNDYVALCEPDFISFGGG
jgi:hypothetical protein